eukprot:CAMPEP_0171072250 /NCGR_PEP_ID=MMETSP0766_2-20121228/10746_1 /TAXON_ID=439317 /ORGANISM="Gambierdiscus australes, Strain CAWD 149" /LENGTH=242 /DNA_ID=CAMNT_0011528819 /DNA_START=31 /DNA_END=759 /DNA_ORIENTATION=+
MFCCSAQGSPRGSSLTTPGYKLHYFDVRGRAEMCRWLFKVAKVDFEDDRYKLTFGTPGDFSTIKRPEFDSAKASGFLDVALGKVPMLEVGKDKIGQSPAIERYLAREFGLMGESAIEGAHVDMLCEHINDFKQEYLKVKGVSDASEKEAGLKKWFDEGLPTKVKLAEKSVPEGPGPFLVGKKVSLADLAWYMFLAAPKGYFDNAEGAKSAFQECPRIKAAIEAVGKIPELQEWIKVRPDTPL